jgi:hypothetical protein
MHLALKDPSSKLPTSSELPRASLGRPFLGRHSPVGTVRSKGERSREGEQESSRAGGGSYRSLKRGV